MMVATLTQTMRAHYCAAFIRLHAPDGSATIVVSDLAAFDLLDLPKGTSIRVAKPPPGVLPTRKLLQSKARQRVINMARRGSGFGRVIERFTRRAMWRLRYLDRAVVAIKNPKEPKAGKVHTDLLRTLEELNASTRISSLVTFDVFDLPTLIRFSSESGTPVIVR